MSIIWRSPLATTISQPENRNQHGINSEIALEYTNPDTQVTENIGTLYVESDAQGIYNYLIRQFLLTLAVNALKTPLCAI